MGKDGLAKDVRMSVPCHVVLGKVDGGVRFDLVYEVVYDAGAGAEFNCIYIENIAMNSIDKAGYPIVNMNTTRRGQLSQSANQVVKWP